MIDLIDEEIQTHDGIILFLFEKIDDIFYEMYYENIINDDF